MTGTRATLPGESASRLATAAERELWLAAQLGDDLAALTAAHAFEVPMTVDADALATAWDALCRAATLLTARFDASDGHVAVVAQPELAPHLEVVEVDRTARAASVIDDVRAMAFDALSGPLARAALVRDTERGGDTIVIAISHLAADGYGWSVLLRELDSAYAAARENSVGPDGARTASPRLPPTPGGALDPVVAAPGDSVASGDPRDSGTSEWWAAYLASLPHPSRNGIPLRQARPRASLPLPASPKGVSLPALTLAAAALAAVGDPDRRASRRRIIVDVPFLAREGAELRCAGTVMNVVPVLVDLSVLERGDCASAAAAGGDPAAPSPAAIAAIPPAPVPAVEALLAACEAALADVRPHSRERTESARRDRAASGAPAPLADIAMNLIPFTHELRIDGQRVAAATLSSGPGDVAAVGVRAQPAGGYRVEADAPGRDGHASDDASVQLATRFAEAFGALVKGGLPRFVDAVHTRAARDDEAPRARLDGHQRPEGRPYRPGESRMFRARDALDRIAARVAEAPDHPAFIDLSMLAAPVGIAETAIVAGAAISTAPVTTTYANLWRSAEELAERLQAIGLGTESLVGICAPRGPDHAVGVLGALLAGAAFVPIPSEPESSVGRRRILEVVPVDVVVVSERAIASSIDVDIAVPSIILPSPIGTQDARARDLNTTPGGGVCATLPVHPDQAAYVIATSGSTGAPKPVVISRGALSTWIDDVLDDYLPVTRDDRVAQFAAVQFDASIEEVFGALCAGATLVPRTTAALERIGDWLDDCERLGVTVLDLPTGYWHELAVALVAGQANLPTTVHTVIIGGEAASPERVRQWREYLERAAAETADGRAARRGDVRLVNTYGPTEATVVATRQLLTG